MTAWASLLGLVVAASQQPSLPVNQSLGAARLNGPDIFRAVHSSMRQWGSSLNHNGMSFFPAVIPEGTILYHGRHRTAIPETFQWLAFEIEHAEAFARSHETQDSGVGLADDGAQHRLAASSQLGGQTVPQDVAGPTGRSSENASMRGYLHIYQATRALRVLYIDGMSGGKSTLGTLDTQDILLTGKRNRGSFDEDERAADLCKLASRFELDGFVRMQPGFEVIHCDFTTGLRQVSAYQQPDRDSVEEVWDLGTRRLDWIRAAARGYQGLVGGRVLVDYSSMVSAFFYPANLTNPMRNSSDLPRLVYASEAELEPIRTHVNAVLSRRALLADSIDWQGVADLIVERYADKLQFMAEQVKTVLGMREAINSLLNVFIDYSEAYAGLEDMIARCTTFYLHGIDPKTTEDHHIYAAFEATTSKICTALFQARQLLVERREAGESSVEDAKQIIKTLMKVLRWPGWVKCEPCLPDEVCLVAMWPFGNTEDHSHPSCHKASALVGRNSYWKYHPRAPKMPDE